MRSVTARPLTLEAYAPYGDVLMAAPNGAEGNEANQGTARRFDRLAALENLRPGAKPNLGVFRCSPRVTFPSRLGLLEKHPASTQVFVPMNARRYLVVVALGGDAPDLGTLAAFVASGTQAVSYRPGVWHHPMIALDAETEFVCLVWEDGTREDCVVVSYAGDDQPLVRLP